MIHLDTHVVVWLATHRRDRISRTAYSWIERERCAVSGAVVLELERLFERRQIDRDGATVVERLASQIGLTVSEAPLALIVKHARAFARTRDPFDRLIVANAMADDARLVTADALILQRFAGAVW